ncbi:MAG: proton-conducting transporter transmembrane domain-containing protein [Acidiferrobacteraceae bacterium]
MATDLLQAAAISWALALVSTLIGAHTLITRILLVLGAVAGILAALVALPHGIAPLILPVTLAGQPVFVRYTPAALWLMGFGLAPAAIACGLGTPVSTSGQRWFFGAALALIGAMGVFGLQDAISFLIAWAFMSFGGALMILADGLDRQAGRAVLFMLALLEVGAVALLLAMLLLSRQSGAMAFAGFLPSVTHLAGAEAFFIGALLLAGFGAKLGILPFYEWFPGAYGSASGATGALLSGVILNAAFFGLGRACLDWLPHGHTTEVLALGGVIIAAGVFSAILAALYAFQQEDWRTMLSLSSAENAAIAVTMLGVAVLFRRDGLLALAGLAWVVALLHLASHALTKGALFLGADGVYRSSGSYHIAQRGLMRRSPWPLGIGLLLAAMSLAALPPQAGFVTEWYVFETVFQGFHLAGIAGRLTLALAGAGLALTAAIALATFVKLFGLALLGNGSERGPGVAWSVSLGVFTLGLASLVFAAGMPHWLLALNTVSAGISRVPVAASMRSGWLLVPLSSSFAFISPSLLIIVMPLLALIPLALLAISAHGRPVSRVPVWFGGIRENATRAATTALSFSNALRTFYSFIYRPVLQARREHEGQPYFVKRLIFNYRIAPLFGPYLFSPVTRGVWYLSGKLRALQSGNLNFYLVLIGALLVGILALSLFR